MADLPVELSPWADPEWRARVTAWVHGRLTEAGLRAVGELEPRVRPWSVAGKVPTDAGPVWFKANPPDGRFEPALSQALSRWVPDLVLTPLAIDAGRGWSLLPDGGTLLGDAMDGAPSDAGTTGDAGVAGWEEPLRRYAELQRAVSGHVDEMVRLGVPDLRPARLPARFAALIDLGPAGEQAALRELAPQLAQWCERLAASPVPASVDHSDLHGYSMFTAPGGRYTFFDWGDASVAHPFTSLLVFLRVVADRHQLAPGAPELVRLRDAYLEPWTAEHPAADLREEVRLAMRVGGIGRALTWQRAFPEAAGYMHEEYGDAVPYWLSQLGEPGLLP